MTKLLRILMCALAALSFCQAATAARPSKPMDTFENLPIQTTSGKALTRAQIQAAIIQAGKQRDWIIKPAADGTLAAHIDVRQHSVDLAIRFDTNKYDIQYKNSTNLGYEINKADATRPLIHPSYNKWVHNLVSDINKEFHRQ